jgi:hypothetical protein
MASIYSDLLNNAALDNKAVSIYRKGDYATDIDPPAPAVTDYFGLFKLRPVTVWTFINILNASESDWLDTLVTIYNDAAPGRIKKSDILFLATFYGYNDGTNAGVDIGDDQDYADYITNNALSGLPFVVARNNDYASSAAERFRGELDGAVNSPFTYILYRRAVDQYRVTDKFHRVSAYNGEATYFQANARLAADLIHLNDGSADWTDASTGYAQMGAYAKRRLLDHLGSGDAPLAGNPAMSVLPDFGENTSNTAEQAKMRNASPVRFSFTRKAIGAYNEDNYVFKDAGTTIVDAVDAFASAAIGVTAYLANSGENHDSAFSNLAAHNGNSIAFSIASITDTAGRSFDVSNAAPREFRVSTPGDLPSVKVELTGVRDPAASTAQIMPGQALHLIDRTDCSVMITILTEYPAVTPPSATIEGPGIIGTMSFSFPAGGLTSSPINEDVIDGNGEFVIRVSSYTNGAGNSTGAQVFRFLMTDFSALAESHGKLEGWGYYPREEGAPANCAEEHSASITGLPSWAQNTIPPLAVPVGSPLGIRASSTASCTNFKRAYPYSFKNDGAINGSPWGADAYLEVCVSATVHAQGTVTNGHAKNGVAISFYPACAGFDLRNGPSRLQMRLVDTGAIKTIAVKLYDALYAQTWAVSATAVAWDSAQVLRVERSGGTFTFFAKAAGASSFGASILTVEEGDLPVDAADMDAACVGFGAFDWVDQDIETSWEFVRYAFYDVKWAALPASAYKAGFLTAQRSGETEFYRSPNIKIGGNSTADPVIGINSVSADIFYESAMSLTGINLPVKLRYCQADWNDVSEASINGFLRANFTNYYQTAGEFTPLNAARSAEALSIPCGPASTQVFASTAGIPWNFVFGDDEKNRLSRRIVLYAVLDSPLLPTPVFHKGRLITGSLLPDVGKTDFRCAARQFLPDFYIRDSETDMTGLSGGWLSPDITVGVYQGPTGGGHADPDPAQTKEALYAAVQETTYPLAFARNFENYSYLNTSGESVIKGCDAFTLNQVDITLRDTGWTDFTGIPADRCYYNRVWVRLSNKGIVPGPVNVQVYFLDSEISSYGVDSARPVPAGGVYKHHHWLWASPMIGGLPDTLRPGSKVVQTKFHRFTKNVGVEAASEPETTQYRVDMTDAVPAFSGWSSLTGEARKFVVAEFIWHMPQAELTPAGVHGCFGICLNLSGNITTTGESATSGVDTCGGAVNTVISNYNNNNVAQRNSNIVIGTAPPADESNTPGVNLKSHIDDSGHPKYHRALPNDFKLSLVTPKDKMGFLVDARELEDAEIIIRLPMKLAKDAKPRVFKEFFPEVDQSKRNPRMRKGFAQPFRYFAMPGGRIGYIERLLKGDLSSMRKEYGKSGFFKKPDRTELSGIKMYFRLGSKVKPGAYLLRISQTEDGKPIGGYDTTVIVAEDKALRYVGDARTKAIYDLYRFPEARRAIPYGMGNFFTGPGAAFGEGFSFGPRDAYGFFTDEIKNEAVNYPTGYKKPAAPKYLPLIGGSLEGAIIGAVRNPKGIGISDVVVSLKDGKSGEVIAKAITDEFGRYLIQVKSKDGKPLSVDILHEEREIVLAAEDLKKERKPALMKLKVKGLCIAAKALFME